MVEHVRSLQERFPQHEIDDFPRGTQTAHLFVVLKRDRRLSPSSRLLHQLLVTRKFFDRFEDPAALLGALSSGEVVRRMIERGEQTVELH